MNSFGPKRNAHRAGFTVVELTVALSIGLVLMSSALAILNTTARNSQFLISWSVAQQTLRQGLAAISADLRQTSAVDGDLFDMAPESSTLRSTLTFGVTCGTDYSQAEPRIMVRHDEHWMRPGDSILMMADNDPFISSDDRWVRGLIKAVDSTGTCPDASPAQELVVPELAGLPDTVAVGGPTRTFEWLTYAVRDFDGEFHLSVRFSNNSVEPIAGPFPDPANMAGLLFEYMNRDGVPATVVTEVTQVRLTLRTERPAGLSTGSDAMVADSALAWIRLR